MSTRAARIEEIIRRELSPTRFEMRDESHLHAGHNPDAKDGSHLRLKIASAKFQGLSRIQQQRLVMDLLKDEFSRGLHALALVTEAD